MHALGLRLCTVLAAFAAATISLPQGLGAAELYPDVESQWRNPGNGSGWDPTKPAGLAQQPPLTAEYQAMFEASLKDRAAGGRGNNYRSSCVLDGMPRIMGLDAPMEILIQSGLTFFIFQEAFVRRIHTDGTAMPAAEPPSFQGYSTGRWIDQDGDGRYDVLEIETRNFKGPRAFEPSGLPLHADNQTVVKERIYLDKSNPDLMHNDLTVLDHALTHPWTVAKKYQREKAEFPIWPEDMCVEGSGLVFIGDDMYFQSGEGMLMPAKKGQKAPDLRYFNQTKK
jgi:hypothetical protein